MFATRTSLLERCVRANKLHVVFQFEAHPRFACFEPQLEAAANVAISDANCVRHAGFFESFLLRLRPVGFYERLRVAFPVAAFGASGSVGRVIGKISRTYAAHISRNAVAKRGSGRRLSHMTVSGSRSCLP